MSHEVLNIAPAYSTSWYFLHRVRLLLAPVYPSLDFSCDSKSIYFAGSHAELPLGFCRVSNFSLLLGEFLPEAPNMFAASLNVTALLLLHQFATALNLCTPRSRADPARQNLRNMHVFNPHGTMDKTEWRIAGKT